MTVTLGDAVVYLLTDDKQLRQGLSQGETQVQGFGSKVKGFLFNAASFAVGGLIQTGITTITSSIGGLATEMISSNAAFEGYETRFGVLLGSTEAAQQRMAELAHFGATTPFELPGVVEADLILQGFGLHSEEAAKKFGFSGEEIRRIAGDVASGTGTEFSEMSLLIGKFSTGATGEAIARMMELGITSREELTKLGLAFDKGGSLLSPLPEAMNVVLNLMKDKYGGLMEAQSQTFSGMMSNLQDWIGGAIRQAGRPVFDAMKTGLTQLLNVLNSDQAKKFLDWIGTSLASVISRAMSWIGKFQPTISNLVGAIGRLITIGNEKGLSWLFTVFEDGSSYASSFFEALGFGEETSRRMAEILGYIVEEAMNLYSRLTLEVIPAIIAFVTPVIEFLIPGLLTLGQTLMNLAVTILPYLLMYWNFLIDNINVILPILAVVGVAILAISSPITFIGLAVVALASLWASNWMGIQDIVYQALEFIQPYITEAMTFISTTIETVLNAVRGWWKAHGDSVMTIVRFLWNTISFIFRTYVEAVWNNLQMILTAIKMGWQLWGDDLMLLATVAWTNIQVLIKTVLDIIGFIIDGYAAIIRGDWDAFSNALKSIWGTVWSAIQTILANAAAGLGMVLINNVVNPLKQKWNEFVDYLKSVWKAAWDSMSGLLNTTIPDAIQNRIINPIKDKWNSFVNGLKDKWEDIWDDMADVVDDVAGSIEDSVNAIISWVNAAINAIKELMFWQDEQAEGEGTGPASLSSAGLPPPPGTGSFPSTGSPPPGGNLVQNFFNLTVPTQSSKEQVINEFGYMQSAVGT